MSTDELDSRSTKFHDFATPILVDVINAHSDGLPFVDIDKIIAGRPYDFALHILMHTIPAGGSTISRKYQGMTIEEICNALPATPKLDFFKDERQ